MPHQPVQPGKGAPLLEKTRLSAFAHKKIPSYNFAAAASIGSPSFRAIRDFVAGLSKNSD
jgi:hypothetical protein